MASLQKMLVCCNSDGGWPPDALFWPEGRIGNPAERQRTKSRSIHQIRKRATIAARIWPIHCPGVLGLPKRNIRQW